MKKMHRRLRTTIAAGVFAACLAVPSAQTPGDAPGAIGETSARDLMAVPIGPLENWTAVAASGGVQTRPPLVAAASSETVWVPIRRGDEVEPSSHVKTDRRGRTTLTRRGDIILVSPESELTLPAAHEPADRIRQQTGKALYQVKPGVERRFEVITPYLVAGVKGTRFGVMVEGDIVSVSVIEGHVTVQSLVDRRDPIDLFAGHVITVDGRDGRIEIDRNDARQEDMTETPPSPRVERVRKESDKMSRRLSIERNRLDLERLWKERLEDDLFDESKELETTKVDLLESRQTERLEEDLKSTSGLTNN